MLFSKAAIITAAAALAQLVQAQSTSTGASTGTTTSTAPVSTTSSEGQVKVHIVQVGDKDGNLKFYPEELTAAAGEMVQFQFWPRNHSVAQSTFADPCTPISGDSAGFFSGFMPVTQGDTLMPTFTIMVNDTKPIWFYCATGQHCQNGMAGVINAPQDKTLAQYIAAAKDTTTVVPGEETGGSVDPDGPNGPQEPVGGSGNGTTLPSGTTTETGATSSPTDADNGASSFAGSAVSVLLGAVAAAFFLV